MSGREWWKQQQRDRLLAGTLVRAPKLPAPPLPAVTDKERLLRIARAVEDGWIADEARGRKR